VHRLERPGLDLRGEHTLEPEPVARFQFALDRRDPGRAFRVGAGVVLQRGGVVEVERPRDAGTVERRRWLALD
jgi:hypothetical protein